MKKRTLRAFSSGLVLAFLLLVWTPAVSAWSVQGHWIDRANIEITKVTFDDGQDQKDFNYHLSTEAATIKESVDKQGGDGNAELQRLINKGAVGKYTDKDVADGEFFYNFGGCGNDNTIDAEGKDRINDNKLSYVINDLQIKSDAVGTPLFDKCSKFIQEKTIAGAKVATFGLENPDNARDIWFRSKDNKTLTRVDGRDGEFKVIEGKDPLTFYANTGGVCPDGLYQRVVIGGGQSGNTISGKYNTCQTGGEYKGEFDVKVGDANNMSKQGSASSPTNPPGGTGSTGSATDTTPRCESGGLSWVICPIINGLAGGADTMFDKLIKPALQTDSISLNSTDPIFQAWSSMRVYGNILLVIGALVIVFGQSIGGGLIDAYTAKKVLPRLLAAAIMINLSIYIVAVMVDVTNILGNSINLLITGLINPGAGNLALQLNGVASGLGLATIVGAGGAVWALSATLVQPILLFILLPLFLAFLGVVVTIILRRGLIMALIIVSPIAFALYCLPNTEQYFKKWWKLLFEALLVYPIVGLIFGIANVMAYTINQANQNSTGAATAVAQLISMVVLVIPLFLIPYSFKLAGGLIGNIHGQLTGFGKKGSEAIKGNANDPRSARNRARYGMRSRFNERRASAYGSLAGKSIDDDSNVLSKRIAGLAARGVNYGNLQAERAMMNEEQKKMIAAQYSQGDDANIRAYWAEQFAGPVDGNGVATDGSGRQRGRYYHYAAKPDGTYKEWAAADVAKAKNIVGKDSSRVQAYAEYEVGKASEGGDLEGFKSRLVGKMNDNQYDRGTAEGVWAGVKFAHQQTRREEKHRGLSGEKGNLSMGDIDHGTLSRELDDSVRSYDFANFRPETAKASTAGYMESLAREGTSDATAADAEILKNYRSVAGNLSSAFSTGQQVFRPDGDDVPGQGYAARGTGGSARSEAEWKTFVQTVQSTTPGMGGGGPRVTPTPGNPGGGGTVRPSGLWTP